MSLSKTIVAERAAVASEQPLASLAGYDVLREGGNAFDAAVATSLALAVTFHPAGGPGGDFFGMFYEAKTGKVHCLNSSGWAPSGLTSELVTSRSGGSIPLFGPLSCVVPGYFAGVWEMHKKFGTIEFKRLLGPSIRLAQDGFPAGSGLCRSVAGAFADLPKEAKEIFAPGGKPPTPGDWIRQACTRQGHFRCSGQRPRRLLPGMAGREDRLHSLVPGRPVLPARLRRLQTRVGPPTLPRLPRHAGL